MSPPGNVIPERESPSGDPGPGRPRGRATVIAVATLVVIAAVPYLNTLYNGFVYDDDLQVLHNPYIKSFHYLPHVLTTTVWSFMGAQGVTNYYRPLMIFGYMVCYKLAGLLPYEFHFVNICLQVAVTLMIFTVALELFNDHTVAWLAACIFAVHPIHTEAVDWIAAVTDLEVTFFYLLTFWFYLRLAAPRAGRRPWIKLAMIVSFALTIFSKEQSLTFPLVAMVYEHFYRSDRARTGLFQKIARYADLWLMDIAYVLFRIRFFGAFAPGPHGLKITITQTLFSAVALVGQYVGKLLWPVHLSAYYLFRRSQSLGDPRVLWGLAAIVVCIGFFWLAWNKARLVSFGFLWMAVTLAPVLDAHFFIGNVFAERYLYLPSAGFAWVAGWSLARLWNMQRIREDRRWRAALAATGCVILVLCVTRIITRNRVWASDLALFSNTLSSSPDSAAIRIDMGVTYWANGELQKAKEQWERAIKLDPKGTVAYIDLGLFYEKEHNDRLAESFYRKAMLKEPMYTDPHLDLGKLLMKMGDLKNAEPQLRAATLLSPLNISAQNALGKLYLTTGRLDSAEACFRASVQAAPNQDGYDDLGDVLEKKGDGQAAETSYRQAISLLPIDHHAHFGIARIAMAHGQNDIALRQFKLGLETDPLNPEAIRAIKQLTSRLVHDHEAKH